MKQPSPNTRMQRTRSSASPPRSPLMRKPLGAPKLSFALVAFLCVTLFSADRPSALGCSCVSGGSARKQVKRASKEAEVVVAVLLTDVSNGNGESVVSFIAQEVWKPKRLRSDGVVVTPVSSEACGVKFVAGERYLIYALRAPDGVLRTSICNRTRLLAESEEDVKFLGVPRQAQVSQ